jgi:hypothetical protein
MFSIVRIGFSCTNKAQEKQEQVSKQAQEKVKYQCPNLCEGDKYCEEQLMCPKCNEGMEIIVSAKKSK